MKDKNLVGDVFVPGNPMFYDNKELFKKYEERKKAGFPCDDYLSADVVPVVRCKDCKHGTRLVCDLAGNEGIECRHGNIAHRFDWFCADGAKMEGEA